MTTGAPAAGPTERQVLISAHRLCGTLCLPEAARGLVVFAHGSGSSHGSANHRRLVEALRERGLGTLLFDLLTQEEAREPRRLFDIALLATRLLRATGWLRDREETRHLPLGYLGSSTGAAAALLAAAQPEVEVRAIVSRGGRPELAAPALGEVRAPTLLIVGGRDPALLDLNREALAQLRGERKLAIVPGATHGFSEPGALEVVTSLAAGWFRDHLAVDKPE